LVAAKNKEIGDDGRYGIARCIMANSSYDGNAASTLLTLKSPN